MDRVNPVDARKGTFLVSFPISQFQDMLNYGHETEMAMFRHRIKGRLVYTRIGKGAGIRKFDTWQIYLLEEGPAESSEKHHDNGRMDQFTRPNSAEIPLPRGNRTRMDNPS